ncbi:MAG: SPFH domain-containing protein [Thermoanaerobaculia bacterium]|jgi:regulator of protease activity HflC (stomatin/prohibitin superfamily)|nr:SPFH domain-containing protein [Thermoanaerobaculia bacterium]MBP9822670.1 SPFH domain-containing protein [Thermoanaerobaculia bacterium]
MKEREATTGNGLMVLLLLLAVLAGGVAMVVLGVRGGEPGWILGGLVGAVAAVFLLAGLFMVEPNQGRVLTLFGAYRGSERRGGLRWANPFMTKRAISLRVRNFETAHLKVNDADGNPIEIAAVVVWRVIDTFDAVFQVDNYEDFVHVQSESALRNLATQYTYDSHGEHEKSLRGNTVEVADQLRKEIHDRLVQAGVDVLEARITHLAYAPEIAQAMLQRQQATAIIAARQKIVEGAVGMVEMALDRLSANKIVVLDEERKAAMVSNLLVVLCSDRAVTPVVNAGTLYNG